MSKLLYSFDVPYYICKAYSKSFTSIQNWRSSQTLLIVLTSVLFRGPIRGLCVLRKQFDDIGYMYTYGIKCPDQVGLVEALYQDVVLRTILWFIIYAQAHITQNTHTERMNPFPCLTSVSLVCKHIHTTILYTEGGRNQRQLLHLQYFLTI